MDLSLNWIGKFVNIKDLDPNEVANKITLHTAEIEGVHLKGHDLNGILVAQVKSVESIEPGYCLIQLDAGKAATVVCTDTTLQENDLVPYAPPGTCVNEIETTVKNIKGHDSEGYLMSEKELGISSDESCVFRVEAEDAKAGDEILAVYPFFKDVVLDLDNKSVTHRPDLWGIYGFAREVAAIYKRPLKPLDLFSVEELAKNVKEGPKVKVVEGKGCTRFCGVYIDGIKNTKAPLEMRTLLFHSGSSTHNLIVDLSNYVMHEVGQPNHTFSQAHAVSGIIVDQADEDYKFTFLDDQERLISKGMLMIHNGDKKPIAAAGIMGGQSSKVHEDETAIMLESANFDATQIRVFANKIKLRTDASNRFEKTLVHENALVGALRFLQIIKEIQPNTSFSQLTDVGSYSSPLRQVELTGTYINKFTGIEMSADFVGDILNRLGFEHTFTNDTYKVTIPWFRASKDIANVPDIVEEIARVYGYDNIPPVPPAVTLRPATKNPEVDLKFQLKRILSYQYGYTEAKSYAWHDDRWVDTLGFSPQNTIELANPRTPFMSKMKTTLLPELLRLAKNNIVNYDDIRLYEFASVFYNKDNKPTEDKSLAGIHYHKKGKAVNLIFEVKDALQNMVKSIKNRSLTFRNECKENNKTWIHQGNCLSIYLDENYLGYISMLEVGLSKKHFNKEALVCFELDVQQLIDVEAIQTPYVAPNAYPTVSLDFNVVASQEVPYLEVEEIFANLNDPLFMGFKFKELFFDKKLLPGKTSYLFGTEIGSKTTTLTSEEIDGFQQKIIDKIKAKNFELR